MIRFRNTFTNAHTVHRFYILSCVNRFFFVCIIFLNKTIFSKSFNSRLWHILNWTRQHRLLSTYTFIHIIGQHNTCIPIHKLIYTPHLWLPSILNRRKWVGRFIGCPFQFKIYPITDIIDKLHFRNGAFTDTHTHTHKLAFPLIFKSAKWLSVEWAMKMLSVGEYRKAINTISGSTMSMCRWKVNGNVRKWHRWKILLIKTVAMSLRESGVLCCHCRRFSTGYHVSKLYQYAVD